MQRVDLYQPLEAARPGPAPLVVRAVVHQDGAMVMGGVPASTKKVESYVLLSSLPEELRLRVELAVQALIQGG